MPGHAWMMNVKAEPMSWTFLGAPLLLAVVSGDVRKVDVMLSAGIPPDEQRTPQGRTALWLAVNRGHFPIAQSLLLHGADPTIEDDSDHSSPISRAAELGLDRYLELMFNKHRQALYSPQAARGLFLAAMNGEATAVSCFLSFGMPAMTRIPNAPTAMHVSIMGLTLNRFAPVAIVMDLVKAGGDINAVDEDGRTPLHYAAQVGDEQIVKYLLSEGAPRDVRDYQGSTPLDLAYTDEIRDIFTNFIPPPDAPTFASTGEESSCSSETARCWCCCYGDKSCCCCSSESSSDTEGGDGGGDDES